MPHTPRVVIARSRIAPARAVLVASATVALGAGLGLAGSAPAQDSAGSEAAARTLTNNLFVRKNGRLVKDYGPRSFTVSSGTNGGSAQDVVASMKVTVDAATKRKYKLASAVIMTGSTANDKTPPGGGGVTWEVKSTRAVAKKLKGVKAIKGVTFKLRYTAPVNETVTKKVDFYQHGTTANKNIKLVRLSSSGDTTDGGGGGGRG